MGAFGRRGWSKTPAPQRDSMNSSHRDNALCSLPCARHLQVRVIPSSPHNSHFTDEETGVQSLADLWEIQLGFNSRAHVFTAAVLDFSDTVGQLGGTGVGAGTGSQGELGLTGPAPAERGEHSPPLLSAPAFWAFPKALLRSVPGRAASVSLCTWLSGAPISAALLLCPAWSQPSLLHSGCFETFLLPSWWIWGSFSLGLWGNLSSCG